MHIIISRAITKKTTPKNTQLEKKSEELKQCMKNIYLIQKAAVKEETGTKQTRIECL